MAVSSPSGVNRGQLVSPGRRHYTPSWLFKAPSTREQMMTDRPTPSPLKKKLSTEVIPERKSAKKPAFVKSIEDFNSKQTIRARPGYTILSLDTNRMSFEHEEKEQEYQDLRKLLFETKEASGEEDSLPLLSKSSTKPKQRGKSSLTETTESSKSVKSIGKHSKDSHTQPGLSVKEFLHGNSNQGVDHFQKHLNCVKKLARRYRRYKRNHPVPGISVQVYD